MLDPGLYPRIAKALGWSVQETQSMSLPSLRDVVRHADPGLANEISDVIARAEHVTRGPRRRR